MTPSELKQRIIDAGHEPHFFSRKTMHFFGDTMKNYGVRSAIITTHYNQEGGYVEEGESREVWELYRKRPVKHGLSSSAYFDKQTFKRVHEVK